MNRKIALLHVLTIVVSLGALGFAALRDEIGHSYYKTRSFAIKKHTTNRTSVQPDTFKLGGDGVSSNRYWRIKGTKKDTSRVYLTWPFMTVRYSFDDTTSSDSVGLKLKVFVGSRDEWNVTNRTYSDPPPYGSSYNNNFWVVIDSLSISSSSKNGYWILTDSPFPNSPWLYFTLEGTSINKKATYVVGTMVMDAFTEIAR